MKCLSEINFRQAFVQFISYTAFLELHAKTRDNNALFSKLALIESDEGFCKRFRPDKAGLTVLPPNPKRHGKAQTDAIFSGLSCCKHNPKRLCR